MIIYLFTYLVGCGLAFSLVFSNAMAEYKFERFIGDARFCKKARAKLRRYYFSMMIGVFVFSWISVIYFMYRFFKGE